MKIRVLNMALKVMREIGRNCSHETWSDSVCSNRTPYFLKTERVIPWDWSSTRYERASSDLCMTWQHCPQLECSCIESADHATLFKHTSRLHVILPHHPTKLMHEKILDPKNKVFVHYKKIACKCFNCQTIHNLTANPHVSTGTFIRKWIARSTRWHCHRANLRIHRS